MLCVAVVTAHLEKRSFCAIGKITVPCQIVYAFKEMCAPWLDARICLWREFQHWTAPRVKLHSQSMIQ